MRVIAGIAKGRRLKALRGLATRPTADRVKESLFGILGPRVIDASFLDLYAGTGSVGIEALSRGARRAAFVDDSPQAIAVIRANLELVGFQDRAEVYKNDALRALKILGRRACKFDIIFIDPPYAMRVGGEVIGEVGRLGLLAICGTAVLEHSRYEKVPIEISGLKIIRTERFGDTMISFYKREDAGGGDSSLPGEL
ncbi:MAG TPA: 16S rRNA (guanine(966)-N(2))-methyltransferase RsmD [Firmicutes bacterium]|nr:16S rRNA (guanine(966)-N(2))-methyltransferase RsmD [Bacillota bacterium]